MKKLVFILVSFLFACQEDTIAPTSFGTLSGTVTNVQGEVVPGAQVETSPTSSIVLTDSVGQFTITGVAAGEYTVTAKLADFKNESVSVTVAEEQTAQVVLSLEPRASVGGRLRGTLRDAVSNQPINRANITTDPPTVALITDDAGHFLIDSLAVGNYTVFIKKHGYVYDSVAVAVQEDKATPVNMLLAPAATAVNVPTQPEPQVAAREQPATLTLGWAVAQVRPNAELRYDVLLYTSDNPEVRVLGENLTDTSVEVSDLKADQTYLWQVVVHDERGQRTVGDVWTFRTKEG